ncbi:MAG: FG-GAP repeat domain-containing protein [Promethearchaeota archaeon]
MKRIKLKKLWSVVLGSTAYHVTFGDLLGNPQPEILTCSYDEKMRVFDMNEKELTSMDLPSSILFVFLVDLTPRNKRVFVTVDIDGKIVAIQDSRDLWSLELPSAIVSAATCDLTGDGNVEVIVGTEDGSINVINNDGLSIFNFEIPGNVRSVAAGDFNFDGKNELIVLSSQNTLFLRDNSGMIKNYELNFKNDIDQLHKIKIINEDFLIFNDFNDELYVTSINGNILYNTGPLESEIVSFNTGMLFSKETDNVAVCFEGGNVSIFESLFPITERKTLTSHIKSIESKERIDKLKRLMKFSDKIRIDDLALIFGLTRSELLEEIFSWAELFNIRLEGDLIVINSENVDDFIQYLDDAFSQWKSLEENKTGKI